jgi:hypothetical protein
MQDRTGGFATKTKVKGQSVVKYQPAPPAPVRGSGTAVVQLGRIASACGKVTYSSARLCAKMLAGVIVIAIIAFAGLYASLSRGPLSITFLVPPIERAVNAGMAGFRFDIGDAVLRKADVGYGIEFRLADVSVVGADGDRIVDAPLASAGVSLPALLRGQLAPREVDLIGPRLFLHYSEDKGLALSAGAPPSAEGGAGLGDDRLRSTAADEPQRQASPFQERAPLTQSAPRQGLPDPGAPTAPPLNLTKLLRDAFAAMRRGETAYLTSFGITDAVVFFDRGDSITRWDVPRVAIDLAHEGKNSELLGEVTVRSGAQNWQMKLRAGQNRGNGVFDLAVSVDDIHPHLLAAEFPNVKALKIWDMPSPIASSGASSAACWGGRRWCRRRRSRCGWFSARCPRCC